MIVNGLRLEITCVACPEQYDVYLGDVQVGYLRLRYGEFRADYPDCGGVTVYEDKPEGNSMFKDYERDRYLAEAAAALLAHHKAQIPPTDPT